MTEFSQGICADGAAILKDGVMLTIEEIIELLRQGDRLMGRGEPVASASCEKERDDLLRRVDCDSDPDVRHWFCFSFIGTLRGGGHSANASRYVGYRYPEITKAMINEQKQQAGLKSDAVLLSITPLGKMTKAQFAGDDQENQIEGGA